MKKYLTIFVNFVMIFSIAIPVGAKTTKDEAVELLERLKSELSEEIVAIENSSEFEIIIDTIDAVDEEATEYEVETILFDTELYEGKSEENIAKEKLIFCGFSAEEAEGIMSDDIIEVMSGATQAVKQTVYMKEVVNAGECELVNITKEEHDEKLLASLNNNVGISALANEETGGSTTVSIDGGTLKIELLCAWEEDNASHIVVGSRFCWDTMPIYRGQDFFGISKDVYTTLDVSSFVWYYSYIHYPYRLTNPAGTVVLTWFDSHTVPFSGTNDVGNNPANGQVMGVAVPNDYNPLPPIQGGMIDGYMNAYLSGACACTINIAQPSIVPTNYLVWATYCHQKVSYSGSISISVPLGASITVEPQTKYEKATQAINMTWNGN